MSHSKTIAARVEAWLADHPEGATSRELCVVLSVPMSSLSNETSFLQRSGRVKAIREPAKNAPVAKRYFALQHWTAPEPAPSKPKHVQALKLDAAQPVQHSGKAKITIAPTPRGRFDCDRVEPYFSAMTPGSYPPSASVIAKVYP